MEEIVINVVEKSNKRDKCLNGFIYGSNNNLNTAQINTPEGLKMQKRLRVVKLRLCLEEFIKVLTVILPVKVERYSRQVENMIDPDTLLR